MFRPRVLAPGAAGNFGQPAPDVKRTLCKFFLAGACERGDMCTWAHGEEELGQPVGGAPTSLDLQAHQGFVEEGVKRTICKFWEEGKCKNGEFCTWAHGQAELGQPIVTSNAFVALPNPLDMGPNAKKTICKFWQQGACTKGAACTFAHGRSDLQAPSADNSGLWQGLVERATRAPTLMPQGGVPRAFGGFGGAVASPGPGNVKRTICSFWEQGVCSRGSQCTWAHGDQELGAPLPGGTHLRFAPATSLALAALGGKAPSSPGKGVTHSFAQFGLGKVFKTNPFEVLGKGKGPAFASWKGEKGAAEQPLKKTICKFWLEGQCTRGDSCTWAHGEEDQAPIMPAMTDFSPREQRRGEADDLQVLAAGSLLSGRWTMHLGPWRVGDRHACGAWWRRRGRRHQASAAALRWPR
ncbi:unnamed protein product [Effrenium voratum]|nr:unnamed protein product [Effrenium voratum]